MFERGLQAMKEGRLSDARGDYEQAMDLAANPAIAFNLAVVYRGLGLPVEATRLGERLTQGEFGSLSAGEKHQLTDFLVAVRAERATVAFGKHCAEDRLRVDGAVLEIDHEGNHLNPGTHHIHATRGDSLLVDQEVNLQKRQIFSVAAGPACNVDRVISDEPEHEEGAGNQLEGDNDGGDLGWWLAGGAVAVAAVTVLAVVLATSSSEATAPALPDDNRFGTVRP